jgi:hypothetical protein
MTGSPLALSYQELFRVTGSLLSLVLCDFVTVESVVTESASSTGSRKRFREMIVTHVGVHDWVSPGSLLSGTRLSYGGLSSE